MNQELRDLYQEVILDHSKNPRNFREVPCPDHAAEGYNALCGDKLTLFVKMDGECIGEAAFVGSGCAISKASASMMTQAVKGKTRGEALALMHRFHALVTGEPQPEAGSEGEGGAAALGKLAVFSGVCEFPARVKCASLPWRTLESALESGIGRVASPATTE